MTATKTKQKRRYMKKNKVMGINFHEDVLNLLEKAELSWNRSILVNAALYKLLKTKDVGSVHKAVLDYMARKEGNK